MVDYFGTIIDNQRAGVIALDRGEGRRYDLWFKVHPELRSTVEGLLWQHVKLTGEDLGFPDASYGNKCFEVFAIEVWKP